MNFAPGKMSGATRHTARECSLEAPPRTTRSGLTPVQSRTPRSAPPLRNPQTRPEPQHPRLRAHPASAQPPPSTAVAPARRLVPCEQRIPRPAALCSKEAAHAKQRRARLVVKERGASPSLRVACARRVRLGRAALRGVWWGERLKRPVCAQQVRRAKGSGATPSHRSRD